MMVSFICNCFLPIINEDIHNGFATFLKKTQSLHINNGFSLLLYRGVKLNKSSLKATPSTK